jgi:hypothetical protein
MHAPKRDAEKTYRKPAQATTAAEVSVMTSPNISIAGSTQVQTIAMIANWKDLWRLTSANKKR